LSWKYSILECYCFYESECSDLDYSNLDNLTKPENCPNKPCMDCLELNCTFFSYADVTDEYERWVLRFDWIRWKIHDTIEKFFKKKRIKR